MNKVCYTINLGKSYVAKKKQKHQSTEPPSPTVTATQLPSGHFYSVLPPKAPRASLQPRLGQPSTRSFGSWRAINRKIFKNDKEMAPLGLKPNSPDYRSRNCTSSKWDLNPYVPFIMQRRARWQRGREDGTAESSGQHSPAMPGTSCRQARPPAALPPPTPTSAAPRASLCIIDLFLRLGGVGVERKERKKRKWFFLIGLLF